jgi:hypothetical protein
VPFTPSHAVVALPFVRTPLVPAAVAVGAMAPDLPLFIRAGVPTYDTTHTPALMPLTIALALVLLLVWRCVLRPAMRELSPRSIAGRLPTQWDRRPSEALRETLGVEAGRVRPGAIVALVASLALGVATHIVWDAFTHEGRWGVALVPALEDGWGPFEGYRWMQHASSAVGMGVLAVAAIVWLRRTPAGAVHRLLPDAVRATWWMSLPVVLVTAWVWGWIVLGPFDAAFTPAHLGYRVLPPACAVWGAGTLVLAVAVSMLRAADSRGRRPRHARDAA